MGEKDKVEKTLEAYNDVFADIVNVLLFNGANEVKEEDLIDDTVHSIFKADGKIRSQERDVAKFWKNCNVRITLYGFENQTEIDSVMPLRIMGYDGASYKKQTLKIDENKDDEKPNKKELYPVVTLVLYFGSRRWKKPRNLLEAIKVPEKLKPFVSNYNINIFEIAYLSDEQVNMFKSDFRIVADYFVQKRKNKKYVPSKQVIKHVEEILQMLKILTGDDKYNIDDNIIDSMKGEMATMDTWLSDTINKAEKKGEEKGKLEALYSLMQKGILTIQQVAAEMGMSLSKLKKELEKYSLDYSAFL